MYSLKELFDNLPISMRELGRRTQIDKVNLARIRDKKVKPFRSTANRLLKGFSEAYGREITLSNVTDLVVLERKGVASVKE